MWSLRQEVLTKSTSYRALQSAYRGASLRLWLLRVHPEVSAEESSTHSQSSSPWSDLAEVQKDFSQNRNKLTTRSTIQDSKNPEWWDYRSDSPDWTSCPQGHYIECWSGINLSNFQFSALYLTDQSEIDNCLHPYVLEIIEMKYEL